MGELADTLELGPLDIPLEPDSAADLAPANRAELTAERARTEAARRILRAIRYNGLSLSLNGAYTGSGREAGSLRGSYSVQLLPNLPILDGFRRQHRASEQAAPLEAQELRERDLPIQVETEARHAVLDPASARQQVAPARTGCGWRSRSWPRRESASRQGSPAAWRRPAPPPR